MNTLKPGALLFFLDSAKELHYTTIFRASQSFKNLEQVYGPHLQEFHTLSMKSVKKFIELYDDLPLHKTMCLSNCFTSCAGWVQRQRIPFDPFVLSSNTFSGLAEMLQTSGVSYFRRLPSMPKISPSGKTRRISASSILGKGKNSWHKMMEYNTRKQIHYRQKIDKLFFGESENNFMVEDLEEENYSELDWSVSGEKILCAAKSKPKRIFPWNEILLSSAL